ncbi:flagellar biosynthetic protein FliO [Geminicoccus roseus]|uniref:flagellar biosynthetic protein FliO n=1 Tax=Geminicoccus roseus TaxID=404900 RepID=UPI000427E375|nr:flagellar biosynthetic protein FliO [Geminicoccus roseus]
MIEAGLEPGRILLAILAVAVLLGLVPLVVRRFRPRAVLGPQAPLEVVAQRALDLRHRVLVIRYRGRDHLLVLGGTLPVVLDGGDPASALAPGPDRRTRDELLPRQGQLP